MSSVQLTPTERSLVEFVDALTTWLGPWHDFIRPPAAAVLAEAARITEQKTGGHQIKSLTPPPGASANSTANGHTKKDEDAPPVTDAPQSAFMFFDGKSEA